MARATPLVHGRSPRITLHLASSSRRQSSHCCWVCSARRPASCQCNVPHMTWYGYISCRLPRRSSSWSLTYASAHLLLNDFTRHTLSAWYTALIEGFYERLSARRLSGTDVQVLVGFGIASLGTVLGTFVAYATFKAHLGADGWKASPCNS